MVSLGQLYAACIVEYARRNTNGVLRGPFLTIGKDARDAFDLPYYEDVFEKALGVLDNVGCLKSYQHDDMEKYYRVDSDKFDAAMKESAFNHRSYYSSPFDEFDRYDFLESYADLGYDFLKDAIERFLYELDQPEELGSNINARAQNTASVESISWTGLPSDFELGEQRTLELQRLLQNAETDLEKLGCPNSEKSMARAYIVAMRALSDSPEPPEDLIWEMIGRVNHLAGVASLFVSIIALFQTAAH